MTLAGHVQEMALVEMYEDANSQLRVRDSMKITPSVGAVFYTALDTGFPTIRASVAPMPDSDGTIDSTRFSDAKAISLSLLVLEGGFTSVQNFIVLPPRSPFTVDDLNHAAWWIDRLSAFMSPSRKNLRLYYRLTGQAQSRYVEVRPSAMSAPITGTERSTRNVQLQFVAPSGKAYAFATGPGATVDGRSQVTIGLLGVDVAGIAFGAPGDPGINFVGGLTFPVVNPGVGNHTVRNNGSTSTPMFAQVLAGASSAMVNPKITVRHYDYTGVREDYPAQVISVGTTAQPYSLPIGQNLSIDTKTREVFLGSNRANRLASFMGATTWPQLRPGNNVVELTATSAGTDARTVVTYSDAYLI